MSNELDYTQLLDKIDEKLENYNTKIDITEVKELVSQIDTKMTENQARANFDAIKEKLEKLSSQLDGTSLDAFQDLKHDIELLVDNNENITNSLEKIQNLQNLTMTSAEFEEYQRQQLDLALKSNDDIFTRLTEIQENTKAFKRIDGIEKISEELERINDKLVARVQEILHDFKVDSSKLPKMPVAAVSEGGGAGLPADSLEIQYKSVRQTYKYVKELKESLETLKNKDLSAQLAKIDEIYENMLTIETWTKEMNLLNSTFENMVAKLSKSINVNEITNKLDVLSEDISNLSDQSDKIDYISKQLDKIQKKSLDGSLSDESAEKISTMIAKLKGSTGASLTEMPEFEDLCSKVDIVYESLSALNVWASKLDNIQDKLDVIKSSESQTATTYNTTALANEADFDELKKSNSEVEEKINAIIENVNIINDRLSEFDLGEQLKNKVDSKLEEVNDEISQKIDEISRNINNFNEEINNINLVAKVSEEIDDNIRVVNTEISQKVESIGSSLETLNHEIANLNIKEALRNELNNKFEEINTNISNRIDDICENIQRIDNGGSSDTLRINILDNISAIREDLNTRLSSETSTDEINDKIVEFNNEVSQKLDDIQSFVQSNNFDLTEQIKTELKELVDSLSYDVTNRLETIQAYLPTDNSGLIVQLKEQVDALTNELDDHLSILSNDLKPEITASLDQVQDKINLLNSEVSSRIDALQDALPDSAEILSRIDSLQAALPESSEESTEQLKEDLAERINFVYDEINERITSFTNEFKPELNNVIDSITSNLSTKISDIASERNNSVENIILSIDEIKDNIMKYDYISQLTEILNDKFEEISSVVSTNVDTINNSFTDINSLLNDNFKENRNNIEREFAQLVDIINDLSTKTESSCDNLTFLQGEVRSISQGIENVTERFNSTDTTFVEFKNDIKREFEKELNKLTGNLLHLENILEENSSELSAKMSDLSLDLSVLKDRTEDALLDIGDLRESLEDVNGKIETSALSLSDISDSIRTESISSEKHYDNLKSDIKEIKKINEESSGDIKHVISEVGNSSLNIANVKEQLHDLSKEFINLTGSSDRSSNNYVYTLFDVESDLIKIHKTLNQNTQFTDDNIERINNNIDIICTDISSISKRTNKLIVNSDDANKKFKSHLEDLAKAITELHNMRTAIENTMETAALEQKINNLTDSTDKINDALSYLGKWIDTVDESLNIIQSNQGDYSKTTRDKVQEHCNDILNKLAELKNNTDNTVYGYYTNIIKELNTIKINNEAKDESHYRDILVKLSELKDKHNSQLDLLLNNDDYYKNFTEQFEKISNKIQEIEDKNSENYKMLLNSEKIFIKLFDRMETLDDKNYLTQIIKKIDSFDDKTVLIKLLQKIEKISKNNSQKVLKQLEDVPDADTVSVKTLEILSPIFEELLKSIQKHGKTNTDSIKALNTNANTQMKLVQAQDKKLSEQANILEKYNTRLIDQAKIMDTLSAKLSEQNETIEDSEVKLSELSKTFDKFDTKLSVQSKSVIELRDAYTQKIQEQTEIITAQSEKIAKLEQKINDLESSSAAIEKLLDNMNSKMNRFDDSITKLVNYIEE